MKLIFLDIDGVLNSDEYFDKIQGLNIEGIESEVDAEKIKLLKKAIEETGAKVVLSSSWRNTTNGRCLKQLLLQYGILTDSTPFLKNENGNGISFGEGLQEKDVKQIIERFGRRRQRNEDELEI